MRFFDRVVKPIFERVYDWVEVRPYATLKREKTEAFIKRIKAMGADYILVGDINAAPCIAARKQALQARFRLVSEAKILVAVREIEGWYLAGLDRSSCRRLKVPTMENTDDLTKEHFNALIPRRYDSRIDFMSEALAQFSPGAAKTKNISFRYFFEKHNLEP